MEKGLKIEEIGVKNHRHLQNFKAIFADGETQIWGMNESGKSAIFDLVPTLIAGMKEKGTDCMIGDRFKVIGPAAKSMGIEATLIDTQHNNAKITLSRTISGSGNGKLKMTAPKGYPHTLDAKWLKNLLSAAFLSPKYFCAKTSREQAILLGCDTSEFDGKLRELKVEYRDLGRDLKPYEALEKVEKVEKVEQVDIEELQTKKKGIKTADDARISKIKKKNDALREKAYEYLESARQEAREFNEEQDECAENFKACSEAMYSLKDHGYPDFDKIAKWVSLLPSAQHHKNVDKITITQPEYADDSANTAKIDAIDERIRDAYETNQAAVAYAEYLKKVGYADTIRENRNKNQANQAQVTADKNAYVAEQKLPFTGMSIGENGELLLDGKEIRPPNFSTGRLIKVVASLKTQCGDNLKTVLIDDVELLDEENREKIVKWLIDQGFQVIMACVGRSKPAENRIVLSPIEEKIDKAEMV